MVEPEVNDALRKLIELLGLDRAVLIGSRADGIYIARFNCPGPEYSLGLIHYARISCEIDVKKQCMPERDGTDEFFKKVFKEAKQRATKPVDEVSSVPKKKVLRKTKK